VTEHSADADVPGPAVPAAAALPPSPRGPDGFAAVARRVGATISGDCVVVSSYPRSGNKMTRTFLHLYAGAPTGRALRRMREEPARLTDYLGGFKSALVARSGLVQVHRAGPGELEDVELFGRPAMIAKTHAAEWPARCVLRPVLFAYLVRHPMDVLASALNYLHARRESAAFEGGETRPLEALVESGEIAGQIDAFIARRGVAHFERGFGTWLDHVMGWTEPRADAPLVALRYEDVADDPVAGYAALFEAAGAPYDRARAGTAAELAGRSRWIELKRGRGYLADVMTRAQLRAAREAFAPALERFGYEL